MEPWDTDSNEPMEYVEPWDTESNESQEQREFAWGLWLRRFWIFMFFAPIVARVGWLGFANHHHYDPFFFTEWPWLQGYVDSASHQAFGAWLWWVSITIIGLWVFYRYIMGKMLWVMVALLSTRASAGQSAGYHVVIILGLFLFVGMFAFLLWEEYVAHFPSPPGWPAPAMVLELLLVFGALCVVGLWFYLLGAYVGIVYGVPWLWYQILYFLSWLW